MIETVYICLVEEFRKIHVEHKIINLKYIYIKKEKKKEAYIYTSFGWQASSFGRGWRQGWHGWRRGPSCRLPQGSQNPNQPVKRKNTNEDRVMLEGGKEWNVR